MTKMPEYIYDTIIKLKDEHVRIREHQSDSKLEMSDTYFIIEDILNSVTYIFPLHNILSIRIEKIEVEIKEENNK